VLITAGAQAAFTLIARVLLKRGDSAIVEEPGYPNVRAVFRTHGVRTIGVAVDEAGIDVASFRRRRASIVHLTPSHQYPMGGVLSLERRFAVLEWAQSTGAWIIEDDYDSEFTYSGQPQPALHGLDGGRRVLYVGTFSKALAPGLRLGYIVVPQALAQTFEAAQQVIGGHPSAFMQSALARFMESGQFARHITRMRRIYDERRQYTSAEISRVFRSNARIRDSAAGLHFVVELPKSIDACALSARASERGIIVPPLAAYFQETAQVNGIAVGFAAASPATAKAAIATLERLL
jgi:GntR family transcriptional regulator/MocR family aminotransferase